MIGDTVNFAARLEALNKEFNSQFLISASRARRAWQGRQRCGVARRGADQGLRPADDDLAVGVIAPRSMFGFWPASMPCYCCTPNDRPSRGIMQRRYITVDVFTDRAFGGNPLAVVLDAGGLSTAQMQAIATEFNYSETTFVLPPRDRGHMTPKCAFSPCGPGDSRLPVIRMSAPPSCWRRAPKTPPARLLFEEKAGLVPVEIMSRAGRSRCRADRAAAAEADVAGFRRRGRGVPVVVGRRHPDRPPSAADHFGRDCRSLSQNSLRARR